MWQTLKFLAERGVLKETLQIHRSSDLKQIDIFKFSHCLILWALEDHFTWNHLLHRLQHAQSNCEERAMSKIHNPKERCILSVWDFHKPDFLWVSGQVSACIRVTSCSCSPQIPSWPQPDNICLWTELCYLPGLQSSTPQWVTMALEIHWRETVLFSVRSLCRLLFVHST